MASSDTERAFMLECCKNCDRISSPNENLLNFSSSSVNGWMRDPAESKKKISSLNEWSTQENLQLRLSTAYVENSVIDLTSDDISSDDEYQNIEPKQFNTHNINERKVNSLESFERNYAEVSKFNPIFKPVVETTESLKENNKISSMTLKKRNYSTFKYDDENDLYWILNNFWPTFLKNEKYDHMHLIDIFKTVIGEYHSRKLIIEHFLEEKSILCNNYSCSDGEDIMITKIRSLWVKAKKFNQKAYITWRFPALLDDEGDKLSHYTMLIADPETLKIHYIDSRGQRYARDFSSKWENSYRRLKNVFYGASWIEVNKQDLQLFNENDHFCQTWSLIFLFLYERGESYFFNPMNVNFGNLLQFWKDIMKIKGIKQALYYQVYCKTRDEKGRKIDDHYFSHLEKLVSGENGSYPKDLSYLGTGYTFLEDFINQLDENILKSLIE